MPTNKSTRKGNSFANRGCIHDRLLHFLLFEGIYKINEILRN